MVSSERARCMLALRRFKKSKTPVRYEARPVSNAAREGEQFGAPA